MGFIGFMQGIVGFVSGCQEPIAIRRGVTPGSREDGTALARNVGWFHVEMRVLIGLRMALRGRVVLPAGGQGARVPLGDTPHLRATTGCPGKAEPVSQGMISIPPAVRASLAE
ncbi:hypothetical protein GCM10012319_67640 [Comamonas sp. KCTC 72670]|nr:hypothetical protein GCM10012319_67640 [Comamonas sp. KCTC 72670]